MTLLGDKLRVKYYVDFNSFRNAIGSIIDGSIVFKDQITTLIGEKVQLFDDLELVCENTFAISKQV